MKCFHCGATKGLRHLKARAKDGRPMGPLRVLLCADCRMPKNVAPTIALTELKDKPQGHVEGCGLQNVPLLLSSCVCGLQATKVKQ